MKINFHEALPLALAHGHASRALGLVSQPCAPPPEPSGSWRCPRPSGLRVGLVPSPWAFGPMVSLTGPSSPWCLSTLCRPPLGPRALRCYPFGPLCPSVSLSALWCRVCPMDTCSHPRGAAMCRALAARLRPCAEHSDSSLVPLWCESQALVV